MTYHFPDHESVAIQSELAQDGVLLRRATRIFAHRVQLIEDAVWKLRRLGQLEDAAGAELDRIGYLVGQDRGGRPDDLYRFWIRARARANRSKGRIDDLFGVLELIVGGASMAYVEIPDRDAELQIVIFSDALDLAEVAKIVVPLAPAGVRFELLGAPVHPFGFLASGGFGFDDGIFASIL